MARTLISALMMVLCLTFVSQSFNLNVDIRLTFGDVNLSDKEILQQGLNGLFEQNKLPDPTTIVKCFDDATAHKTVLFVGELLDKAAKGSVSDLIALKSLVEKFGADFPKSVSDCLDGNAELIAVAAKFGITPSTPASDIEKKIITYITLHYPTVHKWMGDLNNDWKAGKYYQTGFDASTHGHEIFKMSEELTSDKDVLQDFVNGVFEPNKLPDPTTIVPCFDDASAKSTVAFIGTILHEAALLTPTNPKEIQKIKDDVQKFGDNLPQAVKDCLNGNAELIKLAAAYGIDDKTDTDALEKKIIAYLTTHFLSVHKSLQDIDNTWQKGSHKTTGNKLAALGHEIIKMTPQELRELVALK